MNGRNGRFLSIALGVGALITASAAQATDVTVEHTDMVSGNSPVLAVTLTNDSGVSARILSYGATLQSLSAPDRDGYVADLLLGYDSAQEYAEKPNYFGVTVGRYANRIADGRFTLDGTTYQLTQNDHGNMLHGGVEGFDKRNWKLVGTHDGAIGSVTFELVSPDGDQGFPGTLTVRVTYALDEAGDLTIDFDATSDAPTVVNMTNHAIFNLGGEGSAQGILDHRLTIPASRYTPVNAKLIPTGELRPVVGTVFDFTQGRVIADGIRDGSDEQIVAGRGYDHNFAVDAGLTDTPKLMARLEDPASGRVLEVLSTEPGVQIYTGNFLDGTLVGKSGHLYRMGDGIALEPQKFPDTPNQPAFGSARVAPGKPYHHRMIYRLSVAR